MLLERGSRKRRHLVKAREDYGDSVLQQRLIETCVLVDGEEALRITLWVVVGTLSWVRIVEFETPDIVRRLLPQ